MLSYRHDRRIKRFGESVSVRLEKSFPSRFEGVPSKCRNSYPTRRNGSAGKVADSGGGTGT